MENYEKYLRELNVAKLTRGNYMNTVRNFLSVYGELSRESIMKYVDDMKLRGRQSTTINNKLSGLKSYNSYLIETGEISRMFIVKKDYTKIQQNIFTPTKLNKDDVLKMLEWAKENDSQRNYALLYLISSTGIRRAECAGIKTVDLNFKTRRLTIKSGKGNKDRTIILNKKVIKVLQENIKETGEYLFRTKQSGKISVEAINLLFEKYKITPHELRHFAATHALNSGMTISEVANMMGHSNIATTAKYLHCNESDMEQKVNGMIL